MKLCQKVVCWLLLVTTSLSIVPMSVKTESLNEEITLFITTLTNVEHANMDFQV